MQKKESGYSAVEQSDFTSRQETLFYTQYWVKEAGGGRGGQQRYNFTAEHARLLLRRERGRISHLK